MSTDNKFYSRIQLKHDTLENWNKATNFVPLSGELIIYDIDQTYDKKRFKIGDGKTTIVNLPFIYDPISDGVIDSICTDFSVDVNDVNGVEY